MGRIRSSYSGSAPSVKPYCHQSECASHRSMSSATPRRYAPGGTVRDMGDLVLPADTYCAVAPGHEWHGPYHDTEYGFPVDDESVLFERLVLEINQAGLSWLTILKKREGFRAAYDGFDVDAVANYGEV